MISIKGFKPGIKTFNANIFLFVIKILLSVYHF